MATAPRGDWRANTERMAWASVFPNDGRRDDVDVEVDMGVVDH